MAKAKEVLLGPPWRLMCHTGSKTKYYYNPETKETLSVEDAKKRSRQNDKKPKEKKVTSAVVKKINVKSAPANKSPEVIPMLTKPPSFKIPKKPRVASAEQQADNRNIEPMEIDIVQLRKQDCDIYKTKTATFSARKNTDRLLSNSSICVFDTSALIHKPSMVRSCANVNIAVMVPFTVQIELDSLKKRSPHLVSSIQESLRGMEYVHENKPNMIYFENSADRAQPLMIAASSGGLHRFEDNTPDEQIIKTALRMKQNANSAHIFLVSDDLNQRTKAIAHQLAVMSSDRFMLTMALERRPSPPVKRFDPYPSEPTPPIVRKRECPLEERHEIQKQKRKSPEQRVYGEKRYNSQQVVLRFGKSPSPETSNSAPYSQFSSVYTCQEADSMEM